ncbi:hypothetical protein [Bradyrhizobium elkanii]|uniref:hypothetical protein n=1 Tax=Bradyrhizobium elkanii TaxID=29448 RepID=UPI001449373F|nr:hypothetical protein [Bradyrhizobium elkanii]MCP1932489.1 DNA-binding IclR family transcriptional regulator [Bradyrhizobium elkanii]MCS3479584.1 DNA-binding IclR family transcriptional regulator [Bradyrhizobium elkanii]MCS3576972.1 DNA-binding IclR family transcriptional regulator [Bradyrhizobium elkanii]MCS3719849.1 DNA-binding IclR family transcriptional regulator [Bradyrhizobium elkanii]MCS4004266.1 DNA-binding IclR family transcriptional regulator [Bradyrhizobium elkanii USDA 61]
MKPLSEIPVSECEMKALNALAGSYGSDFDCLRFSAIARRGDLDPKHVRRSVRALARKGLAEYVRGLWTMDGEPAGSGYRCTAAGFAKATNPHDGYED